MAGRILIGFAAVAASAAGVYLWQDVKAKRGEVDAERVLLSAAKSKYDGMVSKVDAARANLEELEQRLAEFERMSGNKETLNGEIAELESARGELKGKIAEAVKGVRVKYIGKAVSEIHLDTGVVLRNVKFQNITDTEIGVTHDGGIARIPASSLPAEFCTLFGIRKPIASALAAGALPGAPGAVGSPTSEPPAPARVALTLTQQNEVDEGEAAVKMYQKTQAELQHTRQAYLAQAHDYYMKDERAKFLGQKPKYAKVIPKITQSVNDLDVRLAELSTKIVTLQMKVDDIREGNVKEPVAVPDSPR